MTKESEVLFYDSARQQNAWLEEMIEIFRYRDLIIHLVRRDITARYKRSVLGMAWTMINPLGMMLILSVVFSQIFKAVESYPAYILSGLLMWNFFSQSTVNSIGGIMSGGDLFRRIYMPRSIFAISAIGTSLVNFCISLIPFLLVSTFIGRYPTFSFLLIIIPMFLFSLFALGVALIVASLGIRFPDVVEVYNNILLLAWMYLTPIIYPVEVLPDWLFALEKFNPMFHFIYLFRAPLYYGEPFSLELLGICTLLSFSVFITGWIIFSRMTDEIAYRS